MHSVGQENFEWVVEAAANMAIRRAMEHKPGQDNLTWGTYLKNSVKNGSLKDLAAAANKPVFA